MVCPKCAGSATIVGTRSPFSDDYVGPCPECRGSGIVSCCDSAGTAVAENVWEAKMMGLWAPQEAPFTRPEDYWSEINGVLTDESREQRRKVLDELIAEDSKDW